MLKALDRVLTARAILVAGWVLFVTYAYPGYMSYDSVWSLQQARHLVPYNDWQPPMMALIWRLTDSIIAGPFPMLALQSALFLLGAAALLRQVMSQRAASVVAIALLLSPQNIVVMGVVWKDCLMAGSLLAGIAALLSPRRGWRIAGYAFVFFATAVRYNAAAATLPIVLCLFARHVAMPWWRRYATASGLWLAITVAAVLANAWVVEEHTHVWQIGSAPVDIAGTVAFADGLSDTELRSATPGVHWVPTADLVAYVRAKYSPDSSFLEVVRGDIRVMEEPRSDADYAAIANAWKTLVRDYPVAFLRHRIAMFDRDLVSRTGGYGGVYANFISAQWAEDQLHHRAQHSYLQTKWLRTLLKLDAYVGLRVWAYLVLAVLLVPLCRRQRLAFCLLTSGLAYQAGLFAVAPAVDYRYSHWMVVTTLLGTVILFVTRLKQPPREVLPVQELV